MGDEVGGADIGVKIAGQEINVRNVKSLNTIATIVTMIIVVGLGVGFYFHEANAQQDKARLAGTLEKSNSTIAEALREQNKMVEESNKAVVKAITDSNDKMVSAINKLTSRSAEIACLSDPAMKNRVDARDVCRRLSRDDR